MSGDFGDVLLQLNEVLLQLVVAQQRVLIVGRVVHDTAPELRGGSTNAENQNQENCWNFLFHWTPSFSALRDLKAFGGCCSRAMQDRPRDTLSLCVPRGS